MGHSATVAQLTSAVASYSDPVMSGWARAAAVAAGVAVAGLGAGVATHESRLGLAARDAAADARGPGRARGAPRGRARAGA